MHDRQHDRIVSQEIDGLPFIIFLHIQKTAGMTFQRILRRNFGLPLHRRIARRITSKEGPKTLIDSLKAKTPDDRFFAGHACYGIHRYLPHPYVYVSFLREPLSRLISLYNYSRSNHTAYYHKQASCMSPDDFFKYSGLLELDNGQVRFLAGDENDVFINRTPFGACNTGLYSLAKQNVNRDFALVGLTEQFDASLLLVSSEIGLKKLHYLSRNRSRRPVNLLIPSESVLEDLRRLNQHDIQLYNDMVHGLETRKKAFGAFEKRLKQFKRRNGVFEAAVLPVYNAYDRLKARMQGQTGRPL